MCLFAQLILIIINKMGNVWLIVLQELTQIQLQVLESVLHYVPRVSMEIQSLVGALPHVYLDIMHLKIRIYVF